MVDLHVDLHVDPHIDLHIDLHVEGGGKLKYAQRLYFCCFLGSMLPQYMAVCVSSVRQKNFMATSMQLHKRKDDNGIGLAAVAQDNSGGLCQTWN